MNNGNKKLLIIDDEPVARKVINFALKKEGYKVIEAPGPQEGFQKLNSEDIDLVFCDVMMEGMDGFEFCKKVRQEEKYKALPFIFITAMDSSEAKSKAFDSGADDIITKPVNNKELLAKTSSLLKRIEIYKSYGVKKKFEVTNEDKASKVLLVDDDPIIAKLFQKSLEKAGFEYEYRNNAKDGYEAAKTYAPDLILSDYDMPEINGFEFRKMLLADPSVKDIPFVFLTSHDSDELMLDGYNLNIEDFILKTISPKVVAIKVRNILNKLRKERQKAVQELHEAADSVSMEVVPDSSPSFEGFEISQWFVPFKGIPGGDFIDYINVGDDKLVIVLGDIMGKKWGAWFFAFSYISYIRSTIRFVLKESEDFDSKDILIKINENIYNDAKISEIFTTLSLVILDKNKKSIQYSGAGDLPIIYYKSESKTAGQLNSEGLLLGIKPDGKYKTVEVDVNRGDNIIIFSDGIAETRNAEGEQYGSQRLMDLVKQKSEDKQIIEVIKEELIKFSCKNFEDDISLVVVNCL